MLTLSGCATAASTSSGAPAISTSPPPTALHMCRNFRDAAPVSSNDGFAFPLININARATGSGACAKRDCSLLAPKRPSINLIHLSAESGSAPRQEQSRGTSETGLSSYLRCGLTCEAPLFDKSLYARHYHQVGHRHRDLLQDWGSGQPIVFNHGSACVGQVTVTLIAQGTALPRAPNAHAVKNQTVTTLRKDNLKTLRGVILSPSRVFVKSFCLSEIISPTLRMVSDVNSCAGERNRDRPHCDSAYAEA
jgi:hypothetical protein